MTWVYSIDELAGIIEADILPPAPPHAVASLTRRTGVCPGGRQTFSRISTDTRKLERGDLFFALSGERFDANAFLPDAFAKGACAAVCTKPLEGYPCLVVDDLLKALQRFAQHHRAQYNIPVIALTGSCGKTTSKDLIAAVLATRYRVVKTQGNLNNEIGCPLSLLQLDSETDVAVIEMGANHAGEIASLCTLARPTESAITIVAPAHLEGFGTVENVARAKGEIVAGLAEDGVFYVNTDNEWCVQIAESFSGEKISFGRRGDVRAERCEMIAPGQMRLDVSPIGELTLPLLSEAHVTNVLLAVAVGLRHGIEDFQRPLEQALNSAARCNIVQVGPLTIIDDTYNANPASMAASLDALMRWPGTGVRMAALGEMLELGAGAAELHRELGALAGRLGVAHLFAKGPHACDTIDAAREAHVVHAQVLDNPGSIAEAIHAVAKPGDVLLVKGSRGMQMERVIDALRRLYSIS